LASSPSSVAIDIFKTPSIRPLRAEPLLERREGWRVCIARRTVD
jgi:hypothetical protein